MSASSTLLRIRRTRIALRWSMEFDSAIRASERASAGKSSKRAEAAAFFEQLARGNSSSTSTSSSSLRASSSERSSVCLARARCHR